MENKDLQKEVNVVIDLPVFTEFIDPNFDPDNAIDSTIEALNYELSEYLDDDENDVIEREDVDFDVEDYKVKIAKSSAEIVSKVLKRTVKTDFSLTIEEAIDEDGIRPTARLKTTFAFFEDLYKLIDSISYKKQIELANYIIPYYYADEREKTLGMPVNSKKYWWLVISDFYDDLETNNVENRRYQEVNCRWCKKDLSILINLALYIAEEYDERELRDELWENDTLLDIDCSLKYSFISKHPALKKYYGIEEEERWEE